MKEIENFITSQESKYLINMIDRFAQRSMVVGQGNKMIDYSSQRTSSTSNLISDDPTVESIQLRIARYLGIQVSKGESLQGQRYEQGQFFKSHVDYFSKSDYDKNCLSSGNRTFTFMIYLNDNFNGGTTNFKHLNMEIVPKAYKGVVWNNLQHGIPNEYMHHSGEEVTNGVKYIITSWWRENVWNRGEDQKEYEKKLKSSQLSII